MITIGLRELRQQASEIVRRVEGGESITITVSGRPAALLVPTARTTWRWYDDVRELFADPADLGWAEDRDQLDAAVRDPWQPA